MSQALQDWRNHSECGERLFTGTTFLSARQPRGHVKARLDRREGVPCASPACLEALLLRLDEHADRACGDSAERVNWPRMPCGVVQTCPAQRVWAADDSHSGSDKSRRDNGFG
eukprot:6085246-Pleurochrysis_carterae.AAC.1